MKEKLELPDGSYSVSDSKDYFEYIIKKHEKVTDNPSTRTSFNKTKNRITFRIEIGYHLELLTPETMKILGSTKSKITKDEHGENKPLLEIINVVSILCKTVNNEYQQDYRALYTFAPDICSSNDLVNY